MTETITTTSTIEIEKRTKNESNQRVTASDFSAGDPEHVSQLTQMGIQIQTMTDGRKKNKLFFLLILMRI
jgi:hypothetical protein